MARPRDTRTPDRDALEMIAAIRAGVDPVEQRKAARAALATARKRGVTFAAAVDKFLANRLVNGGEKLGHVAAQNQASGWAPKRASARIGGPPVAGRCGAVGRRRKPQAEGRPAVA